MNNKNKLLKVIGIILLTIILLGVIFFIVDYNRVKNQKIPIFCIKIGTLWDGGTTEYMGLGYKVIDYHKLNGYDKIHIGSLFMKYDDSLTGQIQDNIISTDDTNAEKTLINKAYNYLDDETKSRIINIDETMLTNLIIEDNEYMYVDKDTQMHTIKNTEIILVDFQTNVMYSPNNVVVILDENTKEVLGFGLVD